MTKATRRPTRRAARDSGQALVMVVICAALLAVLAPIIVTQAVSTLSSTSQSVLFEDSLAAAQAGVQQYRNYLDLNSNYYQCSYSNDCGNHALDIATAACPTCGWFVMGVPSSSPAEAFHYFPDPCFLTVDTCGGGQGTAAILLTVTGRAGNAGSYVYRTIQVTLQSTGLLSNAYFSNFEVLDAAQNTTTVDATTYSEISGTTTNGSKTVTGSFGGVVVGDTVNANLGTGVIPAGTTVTAVAPLGVSITLSQNASASGKSTLEFGALAADTMQTAPTVPLGGNNVPLWQALCQYHTYDANTFIDSLYGTTNAQTSEGAQPQFYFGPWRGDSPQNQNYEADSFSYTYGTFSDGTPTETLGVSGACGGPYNFTTGETFNGPVYTEDQLWICGNPDFQLGLNSSISTTLMAPGYSSWPTYSGGAAWMDNAGLDWDGSCAGHAASAPVFGGTGANGNGTEVLPPVNGALATAALNGGCYFTGPTIIEFLQGGSMNVWSPLSGVAGASAVGSTSLCGTWPSTGLQNVTLPTTSGLVIYVGNTPSAVTTSCSTCIATALTTGEALGALPVGANCPDPWLPYLSSCPTLPNGDAIVSGELKGQVTVGSANSIVVSRDLSYQCADDSASVASQASLGYTGFPTTGGTNCTTGEADILGLAAQVDVVLNHPGATSSANDNQVPRQTEPGEWPENTTLYSGGLCPASQDGTEITPTTLAATALADGVPDCALSNPVVDAAIVAVQGSFADEDWDMLSGQTSVWLYGADIGKYRGPFACTNLPNFCSGTSTGYNKEFSYDTRLSFLTPPSMLKLAALLWNATGFVNCGGVNDNGTAYESYTSNLCHGLLGLGG